MKHESDGLEIYVLRLAKGLLVLGALILPLFILMRLPTSFQPPDFINYCFAIYYLFVLIVGSLLSIIVYPFGFLYLLAFILFGTITSGRHIVSNI